MPEFVTLTDVGGLQNAGQRYRGEADAGVAQSQRFQGQMEQSQTGLRGAAGNTFTGMTNTHAGNLRLLGTQFAEQAIRAVRGEQTILTSDEEAHGVQQAPATTVDNQVSLLSRPISA